MVLSAIRNTEISGILCASLLLLNDMVCGGVMTLPNAVKHCGGIVIFIIIHVIIGFIATLTILILGYCSDTSQTTTYQDTVLKVCGKTASRISTISIMIYSFGSCVLCLLVISDQWEEFFLFTIRHQYCDIQPLYLNKKVVMSITSCIFILPFCFFKTVDFLVYPSIFGVMGITYIAILLPVKYHTQDNIVQKDSWSSHQPKFTDIVLGIPAIVFSYQVHMCTIPVYSSMKQGSFKNFSIAVAITIIIAFVYYSTIAIYGYLSFGDHVTTDILLSYKPTTDISVAVMLITVKLYTSYPLLLFCGRQAIESVWMDIRKISDIDLEKNEKTRRILVTLIWFLGSVFIAVFVPNVGIAVRYLGIVAVILIFVIPGFCLFDLKSKSSSNKNDVRMIVACFIIALGVLLTVMAIYQSVLTDGNGKNIGSDISKYTC